VTQKYENQLGELRNQVASEKTRNGTLTAESETCKQELALLHERLQKEQLEKAELAKFKEEVMKRRETKRMTVTPRSPNTLLVPAGGPGKIGDRSTVMLNPQASKLPTNDPRRQTLQAKRMTIMEQNIQIVAKIEEMTVEMGDIEKELTEADQKAATLELALTFTESQRMDAEKVWIILLFHLVSGPS